MQIQEMGDGNSLKHFSENENQKSDIKYLVKGYDNNNSYIFIFIYLFIFICLIQYYHICVDLLQIEKNDIFITFFQITNYRLSDKNEIST